MCPVNETELPTVTEAEEVSIQQVWFDLQALKGQQQISTYSALWSKFQLVIVPETFWGDTLKGGPFCQDLHPFTLVLHFFLFIFFRKPCIDSYRAQSESHVHSATKLHKILYLELCNDFFRNAFRIKENGTFQHMIIANILLRVEKERCSLALQL